MILGTHRKMDKSGLTGKMKPLCFSCCRCLKGVSLPNKAFKAVKSLLMYSMPADIRELSWS